MPVRIVLVGQARLSAGQHERVRAFGTRAGFPGREASAIGRRAYDLPAAEFEPLLARRRLHGHGPQPSELHEERYDLAVDAAAVHEHRTVRARTEVQPLDLGLS